MITREELKLVVVWFEQNQDVIKDQVIKAGTDAKNSESFDLDHLYNNLIHIMRVDSQASDAHAVMYDKYFDICPFAMVLKIIEIYRQSI